MPFDQEEDIQEEQRSNLRIPKRNSIVDSLPKKPNPNDFDKKIKNIEENKSAYQKRAAELTIQFMKLINDKTLIENKNIFQQDHEKEVLVKFIELSKEINNDPNEEESMGSLSCIVVLFKTCLAMRDRLNSIEYELFKLKNNKTA